MAFERALFWEKIDEANRVIVNLARRGARDLRRSLVENDVKNSGELEKKMGYNLRYRDGQISVIKFRTLRYGLIAEHGKGTGWAPGVTAEEGSKRVDNSASRTPKPWIRDAMDDFLPDAANTIARLKGDDMVASFDKTMSNVVGQSHYKGG